MMQHHLRLVIIKNMHEVVRHMLEKQYAVHAEGFRSFWSMSAQTWAFIDGHFPMTTPILFVALAPQVLPLG